MVETVKGRQVTVAFDGARCVHSRNCVLGRPDVFVPNVKGDWIHPDAAPPEVVLRLGLNCPSGAIRVWRNDGSASSDITPVVNTLRLRQDGPLALEAPWRLRGEPQSSPRATLCRCGASANKPFCDGSHSAVGFTATGEPASKPSEPLMARDGVLDVVPQPNGSLRINGNLEVVSGTGRTISRTTQAFLCRCGQSQNKPYCDGSHKAAGFQAE